MPCGSRSRRNRRNRQRKQSQQQRPSTPTGHDQSNSELEEVVEEESSSSLINDEGQDESAVEELPKDERKINDVAQTITTEQLCRRPDELPCLENMSSARSRLMRRNNRCKIEKKVMNNGTQICEITELSNAVPIEALPYHIAGVGIVESSLAAKERSAMENATVTITEPVEPIAPLSEDLTAKVENLPGAKVCMTLAIPTKRFDFLEIQEMTESDAEFDSNNQKSQAQGIIVEAESDIDSSMDERRREESEEEVDETMSSETERQLRSFIEGLKLPSSPTKRAAAKMPPESDLNNSGGRDVPARGGSASSKCSRKRAAAAFGSYQSQLSQESNRCLGIIQEEAAEAKSANEEDEKRHIRDFINEEIGKYRRDPRDLRSRPRDERSFEMKDDSFEEDHKEISVVAGTEEANEVDKMEVKSIEADTEVAIDDKGVGVAANYSADTSGGEHKSVIDNSKRSCDINVIEPKQSKEDIGLKEDNEMSSMSSRSETEGIFMELVKSFKESVINEVRTERIQKSKQVVFEKETKSKVEKEERAIDETKSNKDIQNISSEEKVETEEIKNVRTFKLESSKSQNNTTNIKDAGHSNGIIDIASENSDSRKIKEKNSANEPEVSFEPEISAEDDAVKVKNSESMNEIEFEEIERHSIKHSDAGNEKTKITNETFQNNESNDRNNENINIDTSCANNKKIQESINSNAINSTIEENEIKTEIIAPDKIRENMEVGDDEDFVILITTDIIDNEDETLKIEEIVPDLLSISEFTNINDNKDLCKQLEDNITSNIVTNEDHKSQKRNEEHIIAVENGKNITETNIEALESVEKENKERIIPIQLENNYIIKVSELPEQQSAERIIPIKIDNSALNITSKLSKSPKQERRVRIQLDNTTSNNIKNDSFAPAPPKRSTSLRQSDTFNPPNEVPFCNRTIYAKKVPPPPPVRRANTVLTQDTRYPSHFPLYSEQASKFALFHQRALNSLDFNEKLEIIEFVKSLLTVLSNSESTQQDVQNLLSQYDLEKMPPNIRNIIDDLMAPTPSLSSASTSSEGYTELCNDLYEDAQPADNKIGIAEAASLEIAATIASYYNEAPHYAKFPDSTHASTPTQKPRKKSEPSSEPFSVRITEKHNCETLTETTTETVCEKSRVTLSKAESSCPTAEVANDKMKLIQPQFSCNAVSPTNFQGHQQQQDSSSSVTSLSTARYNPARSSVADIASVTETPVEDSTNAKPGTKPNDDSSSPRPKRKLLLLNGEAQEEATAVSKRESLESPQPIPYSPIDDHLYYVPLGPDNLSDNRDHDNVAKFSGDTGDLPNSLKYLCIQKILSMPCGDQLIGEISVPKFNIFRSLNTLQESHEKENVNVNEDRSKATTTKPPKTVVIETDECDTYANHCDEILEGFSSKTKNVEIEKTNYQMTKNWTGVPTKENPKLLVCFSPSQQETVVKTSADNLLDLHKKFINRHGYHHEHSHSKSPPKYFVDVSPMEPPPGPEKPTMVGKYSNRLLSIIKDNPIIDKPSPNGFGPHCTLDENPTFTSHDEHQERLRVTRLSDWLNLARRAPADNASRVASGSVLIDRQAKQHHHQCPDKTRNCQSNVESVVRRGGRHMNGALIDATPEPSIPPRNKTPNLCRSPVSFNSAIIDKSCCSPLLENIKRPASATGRVAIDPWYINSALIIEDKPEVPPKVKKIVTVDRDCIDTRSIFDQTPAQPRCKNVDSPEALKQVSTAEIMDNLKQLQAGMRDQVDKRKRYSLPQEYFDKQLKYIERLESQLKNVILAEEEEKKASEEFQREFGKKKNKARPYSVAESSFQERLPQEALFQPSGNGKSENGDTVHKDQWKESSKTVDGDNSEYENKEGSREVKKEVKSGKGFYSETSSEKIEKKEEHSITTTNTTIKNPSIESKLRDFLRDLNDPNLDEVPSPKSTSPNGQQPKQRPVSIAAIPPNGEVFRKQMYDEYVHKVLEREERKQHKVIKISSHSDFPKRKQPCKRHSDHSSLNKVEQEFIEKAKSRLCKFGIKLDESDESGADVASTKQQQQQQQVEAKFLVDGREVKDARGLPKHLQEFLKLSAAMEEEEENEKENEKEEEKNEENDGESPVGSCVHSSARVL